MSGEERAGLLSRVEAWLAEPTPEEETAQLLIDLAAALDLEGGEHLTAPVVRSRLAQVLAVVQARPGIEAGAVAGALGIGRRQVIEAACRLARQGVVQRESRLGRHGYCRLYAVAGEGA